MEIALVTERVYMRSNEVIKAISLTMYKQLFSLCFVQIGSC